MTFHLYYLEEEIKLPMMKCDDDDDEKGNFALHKLNSNIKKKLQVICIIASS